ncbi:MAG: hypothetical protein ACRDP3_21880 [Streptomyces sp.]|uniref:hypothetical protein n=1 Tax=Streptomyces sp. TaxID=1931 RepID=UPI003D6A1F34
MLWPMFFLVLAFCGIAVLGVLAVRVGLEVRRFSRAVGDGSERITRAAEDLERAALPLAGRAGVTDAARDAVRHPGVRPGGGDRP